MFGYIHFLITMNILKSLNVVFSLEKAKCSFLVTNQLRVGINSLAKGFYCLLKLSKFNLRITLPYIAKTFLIIEFNCILKVFFSFLEGSSFVIQFSSVNEAIVVLWEIFKAVC
jgi:hypothetical protein